MQMMMLLMMKMSASSVTLRGTFRAAQKICLFFCFCFYTSITTYTPLQPQASCFLFTDCVNSLRRRIKGSRRILNLKKSPLRHSGVRSGSHLLEKPATGARHTTDVSFLFNTHTIQTEEFKYSGNQGQESRITYGAF